MWRSKPWAAEEPLSKIHHLLLGSTTKGNRTTKAICKGTFGDGRLCLRVENIIRTDKRQIFRLRLWVLKAQIIVLQNQSYFYLKSHHVTFLSIKWIKYEHLFYYRYWNAWKIVKENNQIHLCLGCEQLVRPHTWLMPWLSGDVSCSSTWKIKSEGSSR